MFSKVLVANRGEIAVRAFRAAYELGARTVAVFPHEDRNSPHRFKADESYQIGEPGHPVRAYLSVDAIIATARECGADAVYPGYGFLAENPELAEACAEAGLTFVGPPASVLELAGNKAAAVAAARAAGLPVLPSSEPSTDVGVLLAAAERLGFPVFVKAVAGGGGRGMRRVEEPAKLRDALEVAMREAESAFGELTVFVERAVRAPRHIEVQVLADAAGGVVHLYERDCSVQRRHQKVIEVAPAPGLDPEIRARMCADAVAFARTIGYSGAGTVEFLLDACGEYVFIEMNPRIQVEHTVTEEITDVDLVQAQLRIAAGETLAELGLEQEAIRPRGAALQCRITTEDPANGFRPQAGRITAYRSPGGAGVRLDGESALGAEVGAHFDSLLVKLTCRGRDLAAATARSRRALAEFRVRGVATNVAFLQAVLADPDFPGGDVTTSFIEERPHLLTARSSDDRGTKLLAYLADVTVNRPHGPPPTLARATDKLPPVALREPPPAGSCDRLRALGPVGFASALREQSPLAVTDTTFRDAHQSLLATRVRTRDLVAVAGHVARLTPELLSIEAWGGATYDVALRFLHEDPWERLDALREAIPNICLQMLLRGRNTVGYTPYPDIVGATFVAEAARGGIDIFRIFDALNDVEQMRPAIDAVRATGTAVAEVALCYTGDLTSPAEQLYDLDYYLRLADSVVAAGAHVLAIKDMAGLLRPAAAARLVTALRSRFDLPVRLHTHDTAGGQSATMLAAWQAGVDAVDAASAPLAGTTSQPSLSAVVAATMHTERDTGLDLDGVCDLEPYWEAVRHSFAPFEAGRPAPTGRVYAHEIPGGQLSNLYQQAVALGLGQRFEEVERAYGAVDRLFGRPVKVTPSSKVVGDLALQLIGAGVGVDEFAADPARFDLPDSVVGFLHGELGVPPDGWPEPFRTRALVGRRAAEPPATLSEVDRRELETDPRATLNRLLFPGPTRDFVEHRARYGDTSLLQTHEFLYGFESGAETAVELSAGVRLLLAHVATSEPDAAGIRTVLCTMNGQLRPIATRDCSVAPEVRTSEKADRDDPAHIAAPFTGTVTLTVSAGEEVAAGQPVATIEAMKMEAAITSPHAGTVTRVAIGRVGDVEGGDLLVVVGS